MKQTQVKQDGAYATFDSQQTLSIITSLGFALTTPDL